MNERLCLVMLALCLCFAPSPARSAVTLRYALVVGNNVAPSAGLPPLAHAEREARRLAGALTSRARFEAERVRTVTGAGSQGLRQAIDALRAQRDRDRRQFGEIRTVFAFFYSGHGLQRQLTLADGPLGAIELVRLVRSFDADFTVSVVDACYSASVRPQLQGKGGVLPLPGVQVFGALPEDALSAEGMMWLFSSGADELSFEDRAFGGVFTHFFIEALSHGKRDGPGIRIDEIWRYAQRQTLRYAQKHNASQRPRLLVRLEGQTFPYFSFPVARTGRLWLGPNIEGTLLLSYAGGSLVERIEKPAGRPLLAHVYPGKARLRALIGGKLQALRQVTLGHEVIRVYASDPPSPPPGYTHRTLLRKGADTPIAVAVEEPATTVHLGVGYGFGVSSDEHLAPTHSVRAALRLDYGGLVGTLGLGYGSGSADFDTWSWTTQTLVGELFAGWAWDLSVLRLGLSAGVAVESNFQRFDDGTHREGVGVAPMAGLELLASVGGSVAVDIGVLGGARYGPSSSFRTDTVWSPAIELRLALLFAL